MDVKSYYGNVKHSQDEVLSIVLLSGQVEKIIPMLKEGYTVTGKLLETLRVLGREDLIIFVNINLCHSEQKLSGNCVN